MIRVIHPAWGCKVRFDLDHVQDRGSVERALVDYNEARKANPLLTFAPFGKGTHWTDEHPTVSQEHWDAWESHELPAIEPVTRKGVKALCTIMRVLDQESVHYQIGAA